MQNLGDQTVREKEKNTSQKTVGKFVNTGISPEDKPIDQSLEGTCAQYDQNKNCRYIHSLKDRKDQEAICLW